MGAQQLMSFNVLDRRASSLPQLTKVMATAEPDIQHLSEIICQAVKLSLLNSRIPTFDGYGSRIIYYYILF